MTWVLIVFFVSNGYTSSNARVTPIDMESKDACVTAATTMAKGSTKQFGYLCLSRETGEIVPAKQGEL